MLRHRALVVAAWLVVVVAGIFASTLLPGLSSNTFSVPGTDSERAQAILEHAFGERPDGTFEIVFPVAHPADRATQAEVRAPAGARGKRRFPGAAPGGSRRRGA